MKKAHEQGIKTPGLIITKFDEAMAGSEHQPPFDLASITADTGCHSDGVVLAKNLGGSSHLSSTRTNVFTDYDMETLEILKQNARAPLSTGAQFVVTRVGGTVTLPAGTLTVEDGIEPALKTDTQYLLFLTFLPEIGVYESAGANATFEQSSSKYRLLREAERLPELEKMSAPEVLGVVRATLNDCSK